MDWCKWPDTPDDMFGERGVIVTEVEDMNTTASNEPQQASDEEIQAARELVSQARDRGVSPAGPDGLLKALTKTVIDSALDEEMFPKHFVQGRPLPASGLQETRRQRREFG